LVRVRATAVADGFLQAELLEVVQPNNTFQLQPGDVLGRIGTTPMGAGALINGGPCRGDRSGVIEGAELLAYYHPDQRGSSGGYSNCEEYRSCAVSRCDALEKRVPCQQECVAETDAICSDEVLLNGYFSWAVPWGSEFDFGAGHTLASANISVLFDAETCRAAFPGPPALPCNDTGWGCALASAESPNGAAALGSLLIAVCAGAWRLRRARRA
jgi:hypothetical protein